MVETLRYALSEHLVSNPPVQKDIDKILEEYDKFKSRRTIKLEEPAHWSTPYESPIGSNPFMEDFDEHN
jgi:hypothetical protein